MKKNLVAAMLIALAASLTACGKPADEGTKAVVSSSAHSSTFKADDSSSASENLAEPVEGKKATEKKELVIVDEQAILKGYDQVPVFFDSYGVWVDEDGAKMPGADAAKIFAEQPEWAKTVISFNEELTELDTAPRKTLLATYQDNWTPESASDDTGNAPFIRNRLEYLVEEWKQDKSFLGLIDPTAEGAYDLYKEIMEISPESVPLCQDTTGRWFDQDGNIMADEEAEAWFAQYPECAELTRAFGQKVQDSDMSLYALELMRTTFRQGYIRDLCTPPEPIAPPDEAGESLMQEGEYDWWEEELSNLQEFDLPEFAPNPTTY